MHSEGLENLITWSLDHNPWNRELVHERKHGRRRKKAGDWLLEECKCFEHENYFSKILLWAECSRRGPDGYLGPCCWGRTRWRWNNGRQCTVIVKGGCNLADEKTSADIPILSLSPLTIRRVTLCDSAHEFIQTESTSSAYDQYPASDETRCTLTKKSKVNGVQTTIASRTWVMAVFGEKTEEYGTVEKWSGKGKGCVFGERWLRRHALWNATLPPHAPQRIVKLKFRSKVSWVLSCLWVLIAFRIGVTRPCLGVLSFCLCYSGNSSSPKLEQDFGEVHFRRKL